MRKVVGNLFWWLDNSQFVAALRKGGRIVYRCPRLVLCLFLVFGLLLCFPPRKLPLSLRTLEEGLYFGEQNTGQRLSQPCHAP